MVIQYDATSHIIQNIKDNMCKMATELAVAAAAATQQLVPNRKCLFRCHDIKGTKYLIATMLRSHKNGLRSITVRALILRRL